MTWSSRLFGMEILKIIFKILKFISFTDKTNPHGCLSYVQG